jgi:transcriptional regulator with XRE-family HTH domain
MSRPGSPQADDPSAGSNESPSAVAVEELGWLVKEHRGRQSIRQAAAEIGISFSTLSRVEAGAQPDLATFLRLCGWLQAPPERFLRAGAQRPVSTVDNVTSHLFADPRLSPDAAERIAEVVRDLYDALAREDTVPTPLAVHLRAAPTMRPGAPERLASLLRDMHAAIKRRLTDGSL